MLLGFKVELGIADLVGGNFGEEEEGALKDDFLCGICNNIVVHPIVQCKDCQQLYCGEQCFEPYKLNLMNQEKQRLEGACSVFKNGSLDPKDDGDDAYDQIINISLQPE